MAQEKANYSIALMARVLQVTRAGYYRWVKAAARPCAAAARRQRLDEMVVACHRRSRGIYGAPRITADLREAGVRVNVKTVAGSMRRQGLVGKSPRRFTRPVSKAQLRQCRHKDHCRRRWDRGGIDKVWVTDFTYLKSGCGWVYLCAVRDAHSRRVLGWETSMRQSTDVVVRAVEKALRTRGCNRPDKVVLHADRGCQFTSEQLSAFASRVGVALSMGRTGVCWDNAMAESFWASLKVEEFYDRPCRNKAEVDRVVAGYIDGFYNPIRRHSALGQVSPLKYELTLQKTSQPA